jgi:two-component system, NtrC family, sensor histidine kinase HydH
MATTGRVMPLARWSVVAVVALMGAALLVTVWSTHTGVRDASATLLRGQADAFERAIRADLATVSGTPTDDDLAGLLEEHGDDGLRYIAVVDEAGQLVAESGTAVARRPGRLPPPGETSTEIDGRFRVQFRVAPRIPRGRRALARAAQHLGNHPGGRADRILFEFEPVQAEALRAAARRTLGIGAIAAAALLVVALGLVRWVLRREAAERERAAMERERERERRLASLGALSAVLAHEIRNPLASLKGNAQLLAGSLPDGEKPRQKADRVVAEAIRLESLSNDLLEFVRTGELRRAPVDPAALLRDAAGSVDPAIALAVDGAPASWSIDGERMRRVLVNLLDNAVAAGPPVAASLAVERGQLVIEIRDHGPGVADEDRDKIFEPFFTRRSRGTGLGLAVARRLVELHGGTISVGRAAEGGALFRVELPA